MMESGKMILDPDPYSDPDQSFILSRRRASRDFHEILNGDRGGPCHHFRSKTFLAPIHSFAENLAENAPIEVNC